MKLQEPIPGAEFIVSIDRFALRRGKEISAAVIKRLKNIIQKKVLK